MIRQNRAEVFGAGNGVESLCFFLKVYPEVQHRNLILYIIYKMNYIFLCKIMVFAGYYNYILTIHRSSVKMHPVKYRS